MFGLVALQHDLHPTTTLSKIIFLIEKAPTHFHKATTIISFSTLGTLVALRYIKRYFKNIWWIYRMPEVLIVVIISTSVYTLSRQVFCLIIGQYSPMKWGGTN